MQMSVNNNLPGYVTALCETTTYFSCFSFAFFVFVCTQEDEQNQYCNRTFQWCENIFIFFPPQKRVRFKVFNMACGKYMIRENIRSCEKTYHPQNQTARGEDIQSEIVLNFDFGTSRETHGEFIKTISEIKCVPKYMPLLYTHSNNNFGRLSTHCTYTM